MWTHSRSVLNSVARALLVLVVLTVPLAVLGAPSDLDTTFDGDGIVVTAIGSGQDLMGFNSVVQPDGKAVAVGTSHNGTNNDFAVVRYNLDGSLDTAFGTAGAVTTDIGDNDGATGVALQPDGKIVVVGSSNAFGSFDFTVVRYNTDGGLDTTFGATGVVTTNIDILHDRAYAIAVQSDGKIVIGGYARMSPSIPVNNDFTVVRYNSDGTLDTTFDADGIVTTDIGGSQDQIYAMAVQPDGKILVAGYSNGPGTYDFTLVRYETDGSLDATFGTGGIVTTDLLGYNDFAYGLALQPDGKIVLAGYYTPTGMHINFAVVRYNADGTLDATFDGDPGMIGQPYPGNGIVTTDIALRDDYGRGVALQSDGMIVVAGYTHNGTDQDVAVVRYDIDGSLDTGFDTDGKVTTPIGTSNDQVSAVLVQTDGKILVTAQAYNGTDYDLAFVRYVGGYVPAPPDAADDTGLAYTTDEDTPFTTGNVLANDTDPDLGEIVTVAGFDTGVLSGTLSHNGDGTFDYNPNGMFDVLLPSEQALDVFTYVVTDGVLTDTATVTITITGVNDIPVVDAGLDQTEDEGTALAFSGTFTDVDGGIGPGEPQIVWNFGDGSMASGVLTPSHTYLDNGVYTATLTITDTSGGVDQDNLLVTVSNVAPLVDAGADATVGVGEPLVQTGDCFDPGADTWTATVDYGDGGGPVALPMAGSAFTLTHTYAAVGVYTVTVTVEDDDAGAGTDEVVVTVADAGEADLEISQSVTNYFFSTTHTIVGRNLGPDDAAGAIVTVTVPSGPSPVTWTCVGANGATCSPSGTGATFTETLGAMPNGGVVTFTVSSHVIGSTTSRAGAGIMPPAGVIDPNLANNTTQAARYILVLPIVWRNATVLP